MSYSLTRKQAELLGFIKEYTSYNDGVCPSFEEMMEAVQLKSKSGVHRLIVALEERGFISRIPARARCVKVISDAPDTSALASIPTHLLVAELARRAAETKRLS